MSVENILLGLLGEARSGYDLKKDFDTVFSHFWAAEQSQIYRTLKSLDERGLVECFEAPADKGPPRKLYRRTDSGRRQLLAWLAAAPEVPTSRLPYLAQLFFMGEFGDLEQTERWLEEMVAECEARVEALADVEAQWAEEDPAFPELEDEEAFHALLVLRHGLTRTRATRDWARDSLEATRRRSQRSKERPAVGPLQVADEKLRRSSS